MQLSLLGLLAFSASVWAETHDIDVGEDGMLRFEPEELTAVKGDKLRFHFYSASAPHDVVQGSFDAPGPCIPSSPDPFYSGMMEGDSDGHTTFTVDVTSSDPIYFYCSIARHCQGGMVGVVNPPSGAGVTEYRNAAKNVVSGNRPVDGAQGGRVGNDDDDDDTSSTSTRTTTGSRTTTGTGSEETSTTMLTGTAEPTTTPTSSGTVTGPVSGTDSEAAATTTPSGAGKNGMTNVLLGLTVLLGGLVALMA